ncbi:hypothetical protein D3C71_21380 [compost metagenome]
MDSRFGYVYVLTNPSIPGQVKVGQTQRRPEKRGLELSSATGVPEQFELFYYRSFADSAVAERIVHTILEEQGLRTSANREFFAATAEAAKLLIDDVAQRLEVPESAQRFAQVFVARAQVLLDDDHTAVAGLEEALTMLEHAAELGEPQAPYLAGAATLRLLARKRSVAPELREAMIARAAEHFERAGNAGQPSGFAQAADLALALDDSMRYVRLWNAFLDAVGGQGELPQEELEFILAFLEKNMFSGPKAVPAVHPVLEANSRALRRLALSEHGKGDFSQFVDEYVSTPTQRLMEKARIPAAVLLVVAILCALNPGAFIAISAVALTLFGFVAVARRVRSRRLVRAQERRDKRKGRRGR